MLLGLAIGVVLGIAIILFAGLKLAQYYLRNITIGSDK